MAFESKTARDCVQQVALDDINLAYIQAGVGQAVVLVHGLAENHASWNEVIGFLGQGMQISAINLRGHGGTTAGKGVGSLEQLAGDLLAFLSEVTGPAICVGFSLGGVIVLEAALQRPDLVRKAVVVGTSSKVGRAAAEFFADRIAQAEKNFPEFLEALKQDTDGQIVSRREKLASIQAQRVMAVGDGAGYINAAKAMQRLAQAPLTERLRAIKTPVHVIQGENDAYCPQRAADILLEAMPQAACTVIPQAGHLIAVDQPERLAEALARTF